MIAKCEKCGDVVNVKDDVRQCPRCGRTYCSTCTPNELKGDTCSVCSRRGRCYELAGRWMLNWHGEEDARLVHGHVTNPAPDGKRLASLDHAWVEIGDRVWEPTSNVWYSHEAFYTIFKAEVYASYDKEQATTLAAKTRHWGPYHTSPDTLPSGVLERWCRLDIVHANAPEQDSIREHVLADLYDADVVCIAGDEIAVHTPNGRALLHTGQQAVNVEYVRVHTTHRVRFWMNYASVEELVATLRNIAKLRTAQPDAILFS